MMILILMILDDDFRQHSALLATVTVGLRVLLQAQEGKACTAVGHRTVVCCSRVLMLAATQELRGHMHSNRFCCWDVKCRT
jgi:hypothetical protein